MENDGEILYLSVCVHPKYQSKGYGRQILQYVTDTLIGGAKEIRVSIANDNKKSIKLFESFGFVLTETEGSLRNYIYKLE